MLLFQGVDCVVQVEDLKIKLMVFLAQVVVGLP